MMSPLRTRSPTFHTSGRWLNAGSTWFGALVFHQRVDTTPDVVGSRSSEGADNDTGASIWSNHSGAAARRSPHPNPARPLLHAGARRTGDPRSRTSGTA